MAREQATIASLCVAFFCPEIQSPTRHPRQHQLPKRKDGDATHLNSVAALLSNGSDCTKSARIQHDLVFVYKRVFPDGAKYVAAGDMVTDLDVLASM